MSKLAVYYPNPFPHKRAPKGAPDKYVTTDSVIFTWYMPPSKLVTMIPAEGCLINKLVAINFIFMEITIPKSFYFAVSIAPSFPRARPAACLHDYIYEHSETIAKQAQIPLREVLHIADRWFFAQLSTSGFLLSHTYYVAVRLFGYYFHKLFKKTSSAGALAPRISQPRI